MQPIPSPVGPESSPATPSAHPPALRISATHDAAINFAFQQNDIPVLREIVIHNAGATTLTHLTLRISSEPAFSLPLELHIQEIAPGAEFRCDSLKLLLSPSFLSDANERVAGLWNFDLSQDARIIHRASSPVALLARNEWCGLASLPEILAAFILPNDPILPVLLDRAANILREHTGRSAFSGYQDRNRKRAAEQVSAIYAAIAQERIRYIAPPASFERTGQKVRFPSDVWAQRFGTCLDLTLLVAAALENIGVHPLVLLQQGHSYVGCWLEELSFDIAANEDLQALRKRVDLGEILVFETTLLTSDALTSLNDATQAAAKHLAPEAPFRYALDIARARSAGIRPIASGQGSAGPVARNTAPAVSGDFLPGNIIERATVAEVPGSAARPGPNRIEEWKGKLLDLTKRNRLLNFKATVKTIQLLCPTPTNVEDELAAGVELKLLPKPGILGATDPRSPENAGKTRDALLHTHLLAELAKKRLFTTLDEGEHEHRLTQLYREAKNAVEENGTNTLFAAVGVIEWREAEHSDRSFRAPLLLVPVEIKRKSIAEGFILRRFDEETRINVTLLEMLRQAFQKEIAGLDPLPSDENGVDVVRVFAIVQEAIRDMKGWELKPEVWLGQFSFTKHLLWKDLSDRLDALLGNRVVRHLVDGSGTARETPGEEIPTQAIDERIRHSELFCPRSADSSQIAAVLSAAAGHDFVLQGPPGSGKSQTITNIIAHCLAHGKTVLFVAEKRAALDVVFRRLKEDKLDPFCLELHSNKVGKADVIEQFRAAVDFSVQKTPDQWHSLTRDLEQHRDTLNTYVDELHHPTPCSLSAYDCFTYLLPRRQADHVELPALRPEALSREELGNRRVAVQKLRDRFSELGGGELSGLAYVRARNWTPAWAKLAETRALELVAACSRLQKLYAAHCAWQSMPEQAADLRKIHAHALLAGTFLECPALGSQFLSRPWKTALETLGKLLLLGRKQEELRGSLQDYDEPKLLALNLAELSTKWAAAQQTWFLPKWFMSRSVKSALLPARKSPGAFAPEGIAATLEAGCRLQAVRQELRENKPEAVALLGDAWNQEAPDCQQLETLLRWGDALNTAFIAAAGTDAPGIATLRAHYSKILAQDTGCFAAGAPIGKALKELVEAKQDFDRKFTTYCLHVDFDREALLESQSFLGDLLTVLENIRTAWGLVRPWCLWQEVSQDADRDGLSPLVEYLWKNPSGAAGLPDLFERSLRHALIDAIMETSPSLRAFFAGEHDAMILRFRQLDTEVEKLTHEVIKSRLAVSVAQCRNDPSAAREMATLRHELGKKMRHIPVRQLLHRLAGIQSKLKPCVLMSPLSVAQYLEPTHKPFDVVIFDEASQIPVWDAVGAIARGTQLIVVGDPRQLPPTNFFNKTSDDTEEEVLGVEPIKDLESILDDLMAQGVPQKSLRWHYRSRQEGLIAFSNHHYYDGSLLTFPSPSVKFSGVSFNHQQDAVYDAGRSRTNRREAEALVAELVRRLSTEGHSHRSYGVVTFSQAQQELITDLLDEQCRQDPRIENHFGDKCPVEGEPVIVKNLENVQGDERDVILFSICYGPDAAGKISMNFGPLNRAGGERRLNVAITRAKHEMVVFSSIRGDNIDPLRVSARGVKDLRNFLFYAEKGPGTLATPVNLEAGKQPVGEFERMVGDRIQAAGYEVHYQLGCSGYRIDIGVVDPQRPGRYLVAIECDGPGYHRAASARDRDKLRQLVLEGLGWKMLRIWSTDWWLNPGSQVEKLLQAIAAEKTKNVS